MVLRSNSALVAFIVTLQAALLCSVLGAEPNNNATGDRVEWLQENAVRIDSIDPANEDFSDLQPLKEMIGDARVVMLGEQSHGDGATFLAKTRLIKFLHQEMDFDVLAFESGLYDCHKAWEAFRDGQDALAAAQRGIFGIWTRSQQLQPLFDYLASNANKDRPLELCGVDCQLTASSSREQLLVDLRGFLRGDEPIVEEERWRTIERTYRKLLDRRETFAENEKDRAIKGLDELLNVLESLDGNRRNDPRQLAFWKQFIKSSQAEITSRWRRQLSTTPTPSNDRDSQMGQNLIWLANEHFKDRKIIVWAATFHIMRHPSEVELDGKPDFYADIVTMGDVASKELGDDVFSLGFTAYEGKKGYPWTQGFDIGQAPAGSLDAMLAATGLENTIISFRKLPDDGKWLDSEFVSRPLGYASATARWPRVLDAMFFTKRMTPSTPVVDAPKTLPKPRKRQPPADLLKELETRRQSIQELVARQQSWADKKSFDLHFERWKQGESPNPAELKAMEEKVLDWLEQHEGEPGFDWRAHRLRSVMALARNAPQEAAGHLDQAIASYPKTSYRTPSSQSSFQHLVNARCMLEWDHEGPDAAIQLAADYLERDERFQHFYLRPWSKRIGNEEKSAQWTSKLIERLRKAYEIRAKSFPDATVEAQEFEQAFDQLK
ncbi:Erythromycin esterase [Planctomycetes bacterium Pan216]|uniref:Erythromycin esterase n=1 Tax=Kolteria novifilia TaxID=2527975 RepID=A0A518BB32_9BACT|nr:Erythromycin esterase [Planctomycetes bacterium Pan216]